MDNNLLAVSALGLSAFIMTPAQAGIAQWNLNTTSEYTLSDSNVEVAQGVGKIKRVLTERNIIGDLGTSTQAVFGYFDEVNLAVIQNKKIDIYTPNRGGEQNRLWINVDANANSGTRFVAADIAGDTGDSMGAIVADFNRDRLDDIYVVNNSGEQNKLWLHKTVGFTHSFVATDISSDTDNSLSAVSGDVDGDGDLDIFVGNNGENKLWLNDGHANFSLAPVTTFPVHPLQRTNAVTVADVNGDGFLDLIEANGGAGGSVNQDRIWINNGANPPVFTDLNIADAPDSNSDSVSVVVADFNNDGSLDILTGTANGSSLLLNDGSAHFTEALGAGIQNQLSTNLIATLDYNDDGYLDYYRVGSQVTTPGAISLNSGTIPLVFSNAQNSAGVDIPQLQPNGSKILIADFDENGEEDIYISELGTGQNRLWLNNYINTISSITANNSQIFPSSILAFVESVEQGHQGIITYQVSIDAGANWYYWNGSSWGVTTKTDGTETTGAENINRNIKDLTSNGGHFKWRAYLDSTGNKKVKLDQINIIYSNLPTDIKLDGGNADNINENRKIGSLVGLLTTQESGESHFYQYSFCNISGADDTKFSIVNNQLRSNVVFDFEANNDANTDGIYEVCVRSDGGHGSIIEKTFDITVNQIEVEIDASGEKVWDLNTAAEYTIADVTKIAVAEDSAIIKQITASALTRITSYDTTGSTQSVNISADGNTAYVADNTSGLHIVDVSNPATFSLISTYLTPNLVSDVAISNNGNIAYIADRKNNSTGGLYIVDISIPATPVLLGHYPEKNVNNVTLSPEGTKIYLGGTRGFKIINVVNPQAPFSQSEFVDGAGGEVENIFLSLEGNTAYVADSENGLIVFDVSNPTVLNELGRIDRIVLGGNSMDVTVSIDKTIAYVAQFGEGLKVIDITNPSTMSVIGNLPHAFSDGWANGVTLSADNKTLYMANRFGGFKVVDVSDPTNPAPLSVYDNGNNFAFSSVLSADEKTAYVAYAGFGLVALGIDVTHYITDVSYLTANNAQTFTTKVDGFIETLSANNQGLLNYQVSTNNGTTWNYWTGSAWATTSLTDGSETSSATDVNDHIKTLDTDGGQFKWRAYLKSNGEQNVELDQIAIKFPPNVAPVITTNGGNATASINVAENTTAVTDVNATDADRPAQTLKFSITGGADQSKFSIVESTGILKFVSAPNFENKQDADSNNTYIVEISVKDNGTPLMSDTQTITVSVTNTGKEDAVELLELIGLDENDAATSTTNASAANLNNITGVSDAVSANESAYQDYINANEGNFSSPATASQVQAMIDSVNDAQDLLAKIGIDEDDGNATTTNASGDDFNNIIGVTGAVSANESAYQDYINANEGNFNSPATASQVQAMIDSVNDAQNLLTKIGIDEDDGNATTTNASGDDFNNIIGVTGAVSANESAYQDYINANEGNFSSPATASQVQAMIDSVNDAQDLLAKIGIDEDDGNATTTNASGDDFNNIIGVTGAVSANESAYQDYINANEGNFNSPATASQVQAMIDSVNDAQNLLTKIGIDEDDGNATTTNASGDDFNNIIGVTGAISANESAYQAYIDANNDNFSNPASASQVQKMIDAVNDAIAPTVSNKQLSAGTVSAHTVLLSWTAASDNISTASNLKYTVYFATTDTLNTLNGVENATVASFVSGTNGTLAFTSATVNNLQPATKYWFNVIVADENGNRAIYNSVSITTVAFSYTDSDGDGIPDDVEINNGSDPADNSDTGATDTTTDTDGDGIPDYIEIINGTDLNVADVDTDGDGIADSLEDMIGTDSSESGLFGGGLDSDNDGVPDGLEDYIKTTFGISPIDATTDSDGDGLPDALEVINGFIPTNANSPVRNLTDLDGDGVLEGGGEDGDGSASSGGVADNDLVSDAVEWYLENLPPKNGVSIITPVFAYTDSDGDGIPDATEIANGTDPQDVNHPTSNGSADSDGDGISDAVEELLADLGVSHVDKATDTDGDMIPDYIEIQLGSDPLLADDIDSDNDGISDAVEIYLSQNGGAPDSDFTTDTDNDGLPDYLELPDNYNNSDQPIAGGNNAGTPKDDDNDGVPDSVEHWLTTHAPDGVIPANQAGTDTDNDGVSDYDEILAGTNPFNNSEPAYPFSWIEVQQPYGLTVGAIANSHVLVRAIAHLTDAQGQNASYAWNIDEITGLTDSDLSSATAAKDKRTLDFNASNISVGKYPLKVTVTATVNGVEKSFDYRFIIDIKASINAQTDRQNNQDTDQDNIPDNIDGDVNKGLQSVYDQGTSRYVMQANNPLMMIRAGKIARKIGANSADVSTQLGKIAQLPEDSEVTVVGGTYDFEVINMPITLNRAKITIPLSEAIPEGDVVYRKLKADNTWADYPNDKIESTTGSLGDCSQVTEADWKAGLSAGDFCIRILLIDGDEFDRDGVRNGQIEDPGHLAKLIVDNGSFIIASGGGCALMTNKTQSNKIDPTFYLILLLALMGLMRRHLKPLFLMLLISISFNTQAKGSFENNSYYIGAGIGLSQLKPITNNTDYTVTETQDTAIKLQLGIKPMAELAFEFSYANLGAAEVKNQSTNIIKDIEYQQVTLGALYYPMGAEKLADFMSPYLALGARNTQSNFNDARKDEIHLYSELGLDFTLSEKNGLDARLSYVRYSEDASTFFVSLIKRFGGVSSKPAIKKVAKIKPKPQTKPKPIKVVQAPVVIHDADKDGVVDRNDRCEHTPENTKVDQHGCRATLVSLQSINFDSGSSNLLKFSKSKLRNSVALLNSAPKTRVKLQAYTDNTGSDKYNQILSERRASRVKLYLISLGITSARIEVEGHGEGDPVATNETVMGRYRNRRVDFKIVK